MKRFLILSFISTWINVSWGQLTKMDVCEDSILQDTCFLQEVELNNIGVEYALGKVLDDLHILEVDPAHTLISVSFTTPKDSIGIFMVVSADYAWDGFLHIGPSGNRYSPAGFGMLGDYFIKFNTIDAHDRFGHPYVSLKNDGQTRPLIYKKLKLVFIDDREYAWGFKIIGEAENTFIVLTCGSPLITKAV